MRQRLSTLQPVPDPTPARVENPIEADAEWWTLRLRCIDAMGRPHAGQLYTLLVHGYVFDGETDRDGNLEVEIPRETTAVLLTLFPTDPAARPGQQLLLIKPGSPRYTAMVPRINLG